MKNFSGFDKGELEKLEKLLNFKNSLDKKKLKNIYKNVKEKFKSEDLSLVTAALFAIYLESEIIKWESAKRKVVDLDSRFSLYASNVLLNLFKKKVEDAAVTDEQVDMYINIGKDKKVFPQDLLRFICENSLIKPYQVNNIRIFETYSFFKIPNELQDKVIISLSGKIFRGKNIIVNLGKKQN